MVEEVDTLRADISAKAEPLLGEFLFELNDDTTRTAIIETLGTLLGTYKQIDDYLVICDESNNNEARLLRNELWADMKYKPAGSDTYTTIMCRLYHDKEK